MTDFSVDRFVIAVPDSAIADLKQRLAATRWPRPWPEPAWAAGTDRETLVRLADYWRDGFDWRAHEKRLNDEPQFTAVVAGQRLHFVHVRAEAPTHLPLLLTNGWPSTFAEMLPLAHRLAALGHDVVVPSLPGFTFSDPAASSPAPTPPTSSGISSWPGWATPGMSPTAETSAPGSRRGSGRPTPRRWPGSI